MRIKTAGGVQLYVEHKGQGVPCIYLHGGPGYWSKSFQEFAGDYLETNLQMVYLDQRGCGRSLQKENQDYSLERLVQDIEEVRKALNISEWYVLGHSFGGILAVQYALSYSQFTKGLILANTTLSMYDSFEHQMTVGNVWLNRMYKPNRSQGHDEFMSQFYSFLEVMLNEKLYDNLQFPSDDVQYKLAKADQGLRPDPSFQQYVFSNVEYFSDFRRFTSSIHQPVLLLNGRYDHAIGPNHHDGCAFPNATSHLLECGHHPYSEDPASFAQFIHEFVRKNELVNQ